MQIARPFSISKNRDRCIQIYFHLGILPEYHTCDVALAAREIKIVTNGYDLVTLIGA